MPQLILAAVCLLGADDVQTADLLGNWKSVKFEGEAVKDLDIKLMFEFKGDGKWSLESEVTFDGKTMKQSSSGTYTLEQNTLTLKHDTPKTETIKVSKTENGLQFVDAEADVRVHFARAEAAAPQ